MSKNRDPLKYRIRLFFEHNTKIYENLKKKKHKIRDEKYFEEKRKGIKPHLKKKNIILLSNDCVGGMVLKDFGMPSYSPLVNTSLDAADFLKICHKPDKYFSMTVEEGESKGLNYPVCRCGDLNIFCSHAKDFDEAKRNWDIGCRNYRLALKYNYEISVVMSERFKFQDDMLKEFEELPFKHKVLFTKQSHKGYKSTFYISGEENKEELSSLTDYDGGFSLHRRYERFDFYQWFLEMFDEDSIVERT